MLRRVFNIPTIKTIFSVFMVLSMLALALPCNCMAEAKPKAPKNEHPCHSSPEETPDNSHDGNCCCTVGSYSYLESEAKTLSSKNKTSVKPKISNVNYFVQSVLSYLFKDPTLTSGGPPGFLSSVPSSSKTISILFQRWLI